MNRTVNILAASVCLALGLGARADELRNVKVGQPVPAFTLPTISGEQFDSASLTGSVGVLVYLSGEQRSSELAAVDSEQIVGEIGRDDVLLVHATADVVHKPYFERFRAENGLGGVPLCLDASRDLHAKLGLIVFPTTIVIDREGNLAHVISTRGPDYTRLLAAYIKHTAGMIDDDGLAEALKAKAAGVGSPQSLASRHRSAARLLRSKGLNKAAYDELIKAREIDPGDFDLRLDLADLDLAMGQTEDAMVLADEMLAAQPEHRRAMLVKGIALYRLGRTEEAETMLTMSIELNPDPARGHYYLGLICEQDGRTSEALEHYRAALAAVLDEPED